MTPALLAFAFIAGLIVGRLTRRPAVRHGADAYGVRQNYLHRWDRTGGAL